MPSQRARQAKARPARAPGELYDHRAYAHSVAKACDRAFPHRTLAKVKGGDLMPEQAAELKAWRKARRWHPHQLRHNAATRLRRDDGIETARVILGHHSAAVTEVYAEADVERARRAMGETG